MPSKNGKVRYAGKMIERGGEKTLKSKLKKSANLVQQSFYIPVRTVHFMTLQFYLYRTIDQMATLTILNVNICYDDLSRKKLLK